VLTASEFVGWLQVWYAVQS